MANVHLKVLVSPEYFNVFCNFSELESALSSISCAILSAFPVPQLCKIGIIIVFIIIIIYPL